MSLISTNDLPPASEAAQSIAEWMAQQTDWKPGEVRHIPRELAARIASEISAQVAPKIIAERRRQAEAYHRLKDMVIF